MSNYFLILVHHDSVWVKCSWSVAFYSVILTIFSFAIDRNGTSITVKGFSVLQFGGSHQKIFSHLLFIVAVKWENLFLNVSSLISSLKLYFYLWNGAKCVGTNRLSSVKFTSRDFCLCYYLIQYKGSPPGSNSGLNGCNKVNFSFLAKWTGYIVFTNCLFWPILRLPIQMNNIFM